MWYLFYLHRVELWPLATRRGARQLDYPRVQFMAELAQGFTVLEADATTLRVQFVGTDGKTIYEKTLR